MNIYPSAAIRRDYNKIAELCKTTGEPVFLTKQGKGDLVVFDIESWEQEREMMAIKSALLSAKARRLQGEKAYTIEETVAHMKKAMEEALENG